MGKCLITRGITVIVIMERTKEKKNYDPYGLVNGKMEALQLCLKQRFPIEILVAMTMFITATSS